MAKGMRYRTKNETVPSWHCDQVQMDNNGEAALDSAPVRFGRHSSRRPAHVVRVSAMGDCEQCRRQRMVIAIDGLCIDCARARSAAC